MEAGAQGFSDRASDAAVAPAAMRTWRSAIGDGFEAGAIGALVVAVWFLIIDSLGGRPFYTPSLLGTALTRGPAEAVRNPEIAVGMVYAYTGIHFVLFILFGVLVATLVIKYERTPIVGYLLVVAAVVFELAFLVFILAFAKPLLEGIPWWGVLSGNLLAALAMGFYFYKRHPELKAITLPVD